MNKDIKKECENFCIALGAKDWGPAQLNSMQSSFYAGALTAFSLFSELSANDNEDIAVADVEKLYQQINFNICEQKKLMQKLWDRKV